MSDSQLRHTAADSVVSWGHALTVTVSDVRTLADGVVGIKMVSQDGAALPSWQPGAHIDLHLTGGLTRQYSLCGDPHDRFAYSIAVLLEQSGRGGSTYIHSSVLPPQQLSIGAPRNLFPLEPAAGYTLIAGGIGITPILAMARELDRENADWRLCFGGRTRSSMAFVDDLEAFGDQVEFWPQNERGLLPLERLLDETSPDQLIYCCGPTPLLDAVQTLSEERGLDNVRFERFGATQLPSSALLPFEVELASGERLHVPADRSILDILEERGLDVPSSCRQGTCGSCEVAIVSGEADHRDSIFTEAEKAANFSLFVCCSRARSPRLVLDL